MDQVKRTWVIEQGDERIFELLPAEARAQHVVAAPGMRVAAMCIHAGDWVPRGIVGVVRARRPREGADSRSFFGQLTADDPLRVDWEGFDPPMSSSFTMGYWTLLEPTSA